MDSRQVACRHLWPAHLLQPLSITSFPQLSKSYQTELGDSRSITGLVGFTRELVREWSFQCPTCTYKHNNKPAKNPVTTAIRVREVYELQQVCAGWRVGLREGCDERPTGSTGLTARGKGEAVGARGLAMQRVRGAPALYPRCSMCSSLLSPCTLQIDLCDFNSWGHPVYRYVLTIVDHFSKTVWLRPLKSKESAEIAKHVRG